MRRTGLTLVVAAVLALTALLAVAGTLDGPTRWTPDGLFYQARSLELRGADRDAALERTFQGPLGSELRRDDPLRSGNPDWVRYNAQFYERRIAVPLAAAALDPVAGDRAILDLSLAGYVAAILAIFALLLLRFRLPIAAAVTLATIFLPALTSHSSFPLTDSWGLALETAALASGLLVLERGPRWLIPWALSIFVLSMTRDSTWIPIAAAAWLTLTLRSRIAWSLLGTGLAAAAPGGARFLDAAEGPPGDDAQRLPAGSRPLVGLHPRALPGRPRRPAAGRRRLRQGRSLVLRRLPARRARAPVPARDAARAVRRPSSPCSRRPRSREPCRSS